VKGLLRLLAAFAVFLLLVTPSAAQTRVDSLPPTAAFDKARFEFVLTFFGEPVAVGRGAIDGPNRLHLTLKTVDLPDLPTETIEAILYDGVYYVRENDDPQWYIEDDVSAPLPDTALPVGDDSADPPITLIGAADVAGVPSDHYQIWFNLDDGSVITLDTFIGQRTPYVHKLQLNAYSTPEDALALLSFIYRYYDFEAEDIAVFRPENAVPRPSGAAHGGLSAQVKLGMFQLRDALHWQAR
jgi:hypothetical protein